MRRRDSTRPTFRLWWPEPYFEHARGRIEDISGNGAAPELTPLRHAEVKLRIDQRDHQTGGTASLDQRLKPPAMCAQGTNAKVPVACETSLLCGKGNCMNQIFHVDIPRLLQVCCF